jgi:hypothetical protein
VDQLKRQFSGRQKSQSPEQNTTTKPATSAVNVVTNQVQGDASVISKLSAAVAQQVWEQNESCLSPAVALLKESLQQILSRVRGIFVMERA